MFIYILSVEICMELYDEIVELDNQTKRQVKKTLKAIDIALKLNSAKAGEKPPKKLQRLIEWKNSLEEWDAHYGNATELELRAEGLGEFHRICTMLG